MLLYCPKCSYLILKRNDTLMQGETLILTCPKCNKMITFYVKYTAISAVEK
jgi:uncharacterized C2H2 Zn-finger protein